MAKEGLAEGTIRDIKRKTRRKYSAEEKDPELQSLIQQILKTLSESDPERLVQLEAADVLKCFDNSAPKKRRRKR